MTVADDELTVYDVPGQPQLVEITVTDLLGSFDHRIEFPVTWEFVIIFGPNGVGKTRFLELIRAAASLNETEVLRTPFGALVLRFSDGTVLRFSKRELEDELPLTEPAESVRAQESMMRCDVQLERLNEPPIVHTMTAGWDEQFEQWLTMSTPWRRFDGVHWRDQSDGEMAPISELYRRYGHIMSPSRTRERERRKRSAQTVPDELNQFAALVPIHLIETQRLMFVRPGRSRAREPWQEEAPVGYVQTVTQHSDDLRQQLAQTVTAHSRLSQQLDRTFPKRIIERQQMHGTDTSIRAKYQAQNELRARLATFSLIDAQGEVDLPEGELDAFAVKALSTYLDDTERKLEVFTGLLERLELFVEIMNARLVRKTVSIDVQEGISVRADVSGSIIPTESLSSGEQHEMVLLYDLLFRTEPNSVVLIDEPEISLHVAWQKQFLRDILKIARLSSLRFIVATHSPQIIDKWWSRTNELSVERR